MTFDELTETMRAQMAEQPRGYMSQLAKQLGVSRQHIGQVVAGRTAISRDHYQAILDSLGLEIVLQPKSQ